MAIFERPIQTPPGLAEMATQLDRHALANGVTAWLMACTGPFAVMLGVAVGAGLSSADISSWMFGGFALGGILSVVLSTVYRMPLGMGWTIPGVVLLGGALDHLSFAECLGAFYGSALLITVLGLTDSARRITALVPPSIVMAMVAGVFLPFVTKVVTAFPAGWVTATVTVAVFVLLSASARLARALPPILVAIAAGAASAVASGELRLAELPPFELVAPVLYRPALSWQAIGELVIPLTVTVVGIQNMQGFAICRANGYQPPANALTMACGLGSFGFALVGTVPTCVTGPANAILNTSGAKEHRYLGGVVFGLLMMLFGLFAPFTAELALALPLSFIGLVGGLAMFHVLRTSFLDAFDGRLSVGALITFVVTVAGVPIANVGAPFWGLVLGVLGSWIFEREELRGPRAPRDG